MAEETVVEQKPAAEAPEQKPATEEKPVEHKPAEEKSAAQKTEPGTLEGEKPQAPEKYVLTLPDGASNLVSQADVAYLETVARANAWTNEEAQAELTAAVGRAQAAHTARVAQYVVDTKADPELGGDKLSETQQHAKRAIDRIFPVGDPHRQPFLDYLNSTGASDNPIVIRALKRYGVLMAEDGPVGGISSGGERPKSLAERLYPNQAP